MYAKEVKPKNGKYSVYVHLMKPTGKRYVGVTGQVPTRRFQNGYGYEKNEAFFNDIQKYGWDSVETSIIAETEDFKLAHEFENAGIMRWDTLNEECGYNSWTSGNDNRPKASVGDHISEAKMGHEVSEETRKKLSQYGTKAVLQMDLDGMPIRIYESLTEASKAVGGKRSNLSAVCRGLKPTAKGYKWRYI